jgi:hypothetical protein
MTECDTCAELNSTIRLAEQVLESRYLSADRRAKINATLNEAREQLSTHEAAHRP